VDPRAIPVPPDFCFIDGEHTHAAVLSDFKFCLSVCAPNAAICFHDDHITYVALEEALMILRRSDIPFTARKLGGGTFGIFLRDCAAANDRYIRESSQEPVPGFASGGCGPYFRGGSGLRSALWPGGSGAAVEKLYGKRRCPGRSVMCTIGGLA
jgi:hypothetical protein